jgi:hypothetical protein
MYKFKSGHQLRETNLITTCQIVSETAQEQLVFNFIHYYDQLEKKKVLYNLNMLYLIRFVQTKTIDAIKYIIYNE